MIEQDDTDSGHWRLACLSNSSGFALWVLIIAGLIVLVGHASIWPIASTSLRAESRPGVPRREYRSPSFHSERAERASIEPEVERSLSSATMSQQLDAAVTVESRPVRPAVLVLPLTGPEGKVRHDGLGIAAQVIDALADGPEDRIFPAPGRTVEMLIGSECWRPGTVITPRLANACLKSIDAQFGVACALSPSATGHTLEIRFWQEAGKTDGTPVSREISYGRLNTVPGLIALEIFSHAGVSLSEAEQRRISAPQVEGDEGANMLGQFLTGVAPLGHEFERLRSFLENHPRCQRGWKIWVIRGGDLPSPDGKTLSAPRLNPLGLHLTGVSVLLDQGRPQAAWKQLLAMPASWRGDWAVLELLVKCAAELYEAPLVEKLLKQWESLRPGYGGKLSRGRLLVELATRGPRFSAEERLPGTASYRDIRRAQKELEEAVAIHPDGWEAREELLSVALAVKSPRDEMEAHFSRAVEVVPASKTAYRRKLEYLVAREADKVAELSKFAQECVATGLWSQGIPQLTVDAVQAATYDCGSRLRRYKVFERPELWQAIEAWHAAAQEHGEMNDRRRALNLRAMWGALGGHYADVRGVYRKLEADYALNTFDEYVFGTTFHFMYLDDLVFSHVAEGQELINCQIRIALAEGDIDRAERLLAEMGTTDRDHMADGYKAAISLGKRLAAHRRIEIPPEELLQVLVNQSQFTIAGPVGFSLASNGMRNWSIQNSSLVWTYANDQQDTCHTYFPLGIRHATISGQVEFVGTAKIGRIVWHTWARRDSLLLTYFLDENLVSVARGSVVLGVFRSPAGPKPFRIRCGTEVDLVEPVPGEEFSVPVVDDVPSGFAFETKIYNGTSNVQGAMRLADLKIELGD